jgi:signal transduction histidine kinase/CheY-like chemotaxis protein
VPPYDRHRPASRPSAAVRGQREKKLQIEPVTTDAGPPEPAPAPARAGQPSVEASAARPGPALSREAGPDGAASPAPGGTGAFWSAAAPWLMGVVVVAALSLTYFMYDLLQNRLHESSTKFNAQLLRFERYWTLYDATVESALALKWDLSSPAGLPDPRALETDVRRFELQAAALSNEIAQPGVLLLSQAGAYDAAVRRLRDTLAGLAREGGAAPPSLAGARQQAQQVLEGLALIGQEARQRQSLSSQFRVEVEDVRRQVLLAFAGIVAVLVLFGAVAAQWIVVARRERAIRGRAEKLAALAESERARAEEVARDKARFLGMLSHELLTPLQSIWSTMDVIESRGRVDARDPAFTRLKESTRSLKGRISDLVDFAKMSSGRLETRIRGFQLDKLIDTALRDMEEALAAKNLDVHWEAGPELGQRIWSDPARLRQIIDNLLTNAVKYTERGGISIHAQLREEAGWLRLEVSDTGVGIRPDEIGRLYDPFWRSPATAGMAEGSGLGLAVVRSLIELMGGTIRVTSRVGQGTSVVVEIPIAMTSDGASDAPAPVEPRRPVLVIDDSRDARRAVADVFRSLGLDVYEAASGAAGLREAAERDYEAIFLDMQMPDLTGYEVALRLRKPGDRHERSFLVLVSAFSELDEATAGGVFDARIDKPASRKELVAVLARAGQR